MECRGRRMGRHWAGLGFATPAREGVAQTAGIGKGARERTVRGPCGTGQAL
jgi:hypothetical protein